MSLSLSDLQAPFDPTAFAQITGGQLLQLVASAQPYVDKGMIGVTTDNAGVPIPPDAVTYPKWQNYLWLRISPLTTSFTLYAWNPAQQFNVGYSNGSGLFITTNWNPVTVGGIGAGSIQGYQLAAATITSDKIQSVNISQVTGFNPATYVQTTVAPTGGVIGGTFAAGLTLNNAAVTSASIAALAVLTAAIADKNVTVGKLLGGALGQLPQTADGANTVAWTTPPQIYSGLSNPNAGGSNDGQLVAVLSGAAGTFQYLTAKQAGIYKQQNFASVVTSTAVAVTTANSPTLNYNTANLQPITQAAIATPTNPSFHMVTIAGCISVPSGASYGWIYLYNATGATAPLAAVTVTNNTGSTNAYPFCLKFRVAIAAGTAVTYYAVFGGTAGAKVSANAETTSITVEETL